MWVCVCVGRGVDRSMENTIILCTMLTSDLQLLYNQFLFVLENRRFFLDHLLIFYRKVNCKEAFAYLLLRLTSSWYLEHNKWEGCDEILGLKTDIKTTVP